MAQGSTRKMANPEELLDGETPPLLTVCVLSYNSRSLVIETLESIAKSKYPNIEVLCFDDGSTDGSDRIAERTCREHGFTFLRNAKNIGIPATCNLALAQARGSFFSVIGDDLVSDSRYIHDVSNLLKSDDAVLIFSELQTFQRLEDSSLDRFGVWSEDVTEHRQSLLSAWLKGSKITSPSVTYRTSALRALGGFDESFLFEDRALYLKIASQGLLCLRSTAVLTLYRKTQGSLSATLAAREFLDELRLFEVLPGGLPRSALTLRLVLLALAKSLVYEVHPDMLRACLETAGLGKINTIIDSKLVKLLFTLVYKLFSGEELSWVRIRRFVKN